MSPLLLERRDMFKIGLLSTVVAAMVFSSGFMMGYQKAENTLVAGAVSSPLELPASTEKALSEIEPQIPAVIAVGANIDVDQPDPVRPGDDVHASAGSGSESAPESLPESFPESLPGSSIEPDPEYSPEYKAEISDAKSVVETPVTALEVTENTAASSKQSETDASAAVIATPPVALMPSIAEISTARYSIQVGMYGSLVNAENMVKMLQAQEMPAYVSEYYNRKNELRFNVRFGFFKDKSSALTALDDYKRAQNGDGYLVRVTPESVSRLTASSDSTKPVDSATEAQSLSGDSTS